MTPAEFTRQLNELRAIIGYGMNFFSAWQELMVEDEESVCALNQYRGLFLTAREALSRAAILQFAKVFDYAARASESTVSLPNLVRAAKIDLAGLIPHGTLQDLQEIEQKMEANKRVLSRLQTVRNQRTAHHQAVPSKKARLRFGETKRLADEIQSMYNCLRRAHDGKGTSFDPMAREVKHHTAAVVGIMKEEMERVRETTKRMEEDTRT